MNHRKALDRRRFLKHVVHLGEGLLISQVLGACHDMELDGDLTDQISSITPEMWITEPSTATEIATSKPPSQVASSATASSTGEQKMTQIAFVKTTDRAEGVRRAIDLLEKNPFRGKNLFLKPNFNSADPTPGSTHNDTLREMILHLQGMGAERILVGDRSGMGDTEAVMRKKEIFRMAEELHFDTLIFDQLDAEEWTSFPANGSHWSRGFSVPRTVLEADGVIQTCCLKTHRFGGHFTLSLKNSVGLVAKVIPGEGYNYMNELHGSPYQRLMIAEINTAYKPDLIVIDGIEAFVNAGPDDGKRVDSQVMLAGADRVALDAVGVAILRYFGTTPEVSTGSIFEQEQIARAVELGLGVGTPAEIELVTGDNESKAYADQIKEILSQG